MQTQEHVPGARDWIDLGEIYRVHKRDGLETVVFRLYKYHGELYFDVRLHFLDEATGDYRPTKKGLRMNVDCLEGFCQGLASLGNAIAEYVNHNNAANVGGYQ